MTSETSTRARRHEHLEHRGCRIGAAAAIITPPPGPMAGYASRTHHATDAEVELMARVTVFDDGRTAVALVVLDLLFTTTALSRAVQDAIAAATPIPADHVIVTATHTHSGPADLSTSQGSVVRLFVADACSRAAERAWAERREAVLVTGETTVGGVSAHRRSRAGQPDETLTLVTALDVVTAKPIASIVGFACHATVHGASQAQWSPDYPGAVCAALDYWGGGAGGTTSFLQGCAGDVNPVYTEHAARGWPDAVRVGEVLAAAALMLLRDAQGLVRGLSTESPSLEAVLPAGSRSRCRVVTPGALEVASVLVDVDLAPAPVAAAGSDLDPGSDDPFVRSRRWVEDLRAHDPNLFGSVEQLDRLPVVVARLGADLHLAALPGEPFSVAARHIRAGSNGAVLVAGYSSASVGYLPSREDHLVGGYEVGACQYHPGALERVVDAATSMLRELH